MLGAVAAQGACPGLRTNAPIRALKTYSEQLALAEQNAILAGEPSLWKTVFKALGRTILRAVSNETKAIDGLA